MTLDRVKLGRAVTFMKYLAGVVSLIFLQTKLIWNKIPFPTSNSLNFAELVENGLRKSVSKKRTNIHFSIQFIAVYCKDLRTKELDSFTKIVISIVFYQNTYFPEHFLLTAFATLKE